MWSKDKPSHDGIFEYTECVMPIRYGRIRVDGNSVTRLDGPIHTEYDMDTWVNIMSNETFYQEVA